MTTRQADAVLWFDHADSRRVEIAGGKGASLASMTALGLPVPPGFLVPAGALDRMLRRSGLADEMLSILSSIGSEDECAAASERLRDLVLGSPITGSLADAICDAYLRLDQGSGVAVRSSACAEDGATASYAGQQDTYLNVRGAEQVLHFVSRCWASFFGTRALFYRRVKGSLRDLGMAVVVQRQLDANKAGVMFTVDPVRRRRDQMLIEAAWGLGEAVVAGTVIPDQYLVTRDGRLKKVQPSRQDRMVVRRPDGGTEEVELPAEQAVGPVLDESELSQLVGLGLRAEEIFGGPQDVEWAFEHGTLYLLQSRPVTA